MRLLAHPQRSMENGIHEEATVELTSHRGAIEGGNQACFAKDQLWSQQGLLLLLARKDRQVQWNGYCYLRSKCCLCTIDRGSQGGRNEVEHIKWIVCLCLVRMSMEVHGETET